ncbi:hypothetical protein HDU96_004587 [Phlyctochytrium bullatum]|nr:hypothetical protein HDU96_004587 [Phlyctochytrium bullatum]
MLKGRIVFAGCILLSFLFGVLSTHLLFPGQASTAGRDHVKLTRANRYGIKNPSTTIPIPVDSLPLASRKAPQPTDPTDDGTKLIGRKVNYQLYLDSLTKALKRGRSLTVSGFKHCSLLNNSTYDTLAVAISLNMVMEKATSSRQLVEYVEAKAQEISAVLIKAHPDLDAELGFIIMATGNASAIDNFRFLLNELDDGTATFMIHVDEESEALYTEITKYVTLRQNERQRLLAKSAEGIHKNIYFASKRFRGSGQTYPLLAILNTMWEFSDLVAWDNVINLSLYEVPLRKSREILRILSLPQNRNRNFVHLGQSEGTVATLFGTASE